jgi:hypothetical protein
MTEVTGPGGGSMNNISLSKIVSHGKHTRSSNTTEHQDKLSSLFFIGIGFFLFFLASFLSMNDPDKLPDGISVRISKSKL